MIDREPIANIKERRLGKFIFVDESRPANIVVFQAPRARAPLPLDTPVVPQSIAEQIQEPLITNPWLTVFNERQAKIAARRLQ